MNGAVRARDGRDSRDSTPIPSTTSSLTSQFQAVHFHCFYLKRTILVLLIPWPRYLVCINVASPVLWFPRHMDLALLMSNIDVKIMRIRTSEQTRFISADDTSLPLPPGDSGVTMSDLRLQAKSVSLTFPKNLACRKRHLQEGVSVMCLSLT